MLMFDEEGPSDIHAVDRMLASEAEIALASAMMRPEGAGEIAPVAPACREYTSHERGPAAPPAFEPPIARTQARALAHLNPVPPPDSIGQPTTAASPAASASVPFTRARPSMLQPADPAPHATQAAGVVADRSNVASPAPLTRGAASVASPSITAPPISFARGAGPAARTLPPVHTATAPERVPAAQARRQPTMLNRVAQLSVQSLALINLPLRLLPDSMRPTVNLIAISLALWVPAVWAMAPMMAARESSRTPPQGSMPVHDESSLKAEGNTPARTKTAGRGRP